MTPKKLAEGQVFRALHPLDEGRRIRIDTLSACASHVWVVDAETGKRGRYILATALHLNPLTKNGLARRSGYVLEEAP